MYSKNIKATFTGKDGSNGFRTNERYSLKMSHRIGLYITIYGPYGTIPTEYESMISFLNNWNKIKVKNG